MEDARAFRITLLTLCVAILVHDAIALALNPSFAVGAAAHTIKFLGVDYNGWHAVAGFALFGPGLFVWRKAGLARVYALAVVLALAITAAWGLLDAHPLGILTLPDQRADAIFHCCVAAIFTLPLLADAIGAATRPKAVKNLS